MMVMIPVTLGLAILASSLALTIPYQKIQRQEAHTEVYVGNFVGYRSAVQAYYRANPSAIGFVSDTDLSPYWPTGYVRNLNAWQWSNTIDGGQVYVFIDTTRPYCLVASCPAVAEKIFEQQGRPVSIGIAVDSGGARRLSNPASGLTSIAIPATIGIGAVVAVGR